jgi:glycerol-3-phosphate dehydrogenase
MGEKLSEELPYLKAEVIYAVTHEGAQSVDDVLSRRTRIYFEATDGGESLASLVASLIAPILDWDAAAKKMSVSDYLKLLKSERIALKKLLAQVG